MKAMTLEEAKTVADSVLSNLIHYPRKKHFFKSDDVTTIAIALIKAQNQMLT